MKTLTLSLLLGALMLVAAPNASAQTGTFCFDDGIYQWTVVVNNNATDLIVGSVGGWTAGAIGVGGRGQSNTTIRHHVLTAINPFLADDPGCGDGNGFTDWFTYNGKVTGNSFPFTYSGDWVNSCGSTGTFTGPLSTGACLSPAPRPSEAVPGSPGSTLLPDMPELEVER